MEDRINDLIEGAGIAAPLVFVAAEVAITMLFLPRTPGAVAAGAAFGTGAGTLLTWLAMMLGAVAAFAVGRLGRRAGGRATRWLSDRQRAQIAPWIERLDAWMQRRGPLAVLYGRLLPGMPFTSINYAAGATSLRARHFLIATGVGIVPSTYLLVALGASLAHPTSPTFIVIAAITVALAIAAPSVDRAMREGQRSSARIEQ